MISGIQSSSKRKRLQECSRQRDTARTHYSHLTVFSPDKHPRQSILFVWTDKQSLCSCVILKYKTSSTNVTKKNYVFSKYKTQLQIHKQVPKIKTQYLWIHLIDLQINECICEYFPQHLKFWNIYWWIQILFVNPNSTIANLHFMDTAYFC